MTNSSENSMEPILVPPLKPKEERERDEKKFPATKITLEEMLESSLVVRGEEHHWQDR